MALNRFKSEGNDDKLKRIPREIAILPLRNVVAYPYMVLSLAVAAPRFMKLIEDAVANSHLGDVMMESARIAHSYVRSKAVDLGIEAKRFKDTDIHLHVPAGAIPKDGPSAGLAMVMTMAGIYTGQPVRSDLGLTGEVTLRGRVLPVGGIKIKVLAAHRAGLRTLILPRRNDRDLDQLPPEVGREMTVRLVDRVEDGFVLSFRPGKEHEAGTQKRMPAMG